MSQLTLDIKQNKAHPFRSNWSMDLGCAIYTENSDLAVLAKFGGGVSLAFDLLVDLGAGVE